MIFAKLKDSKITWSIDYFNLHESLLLLHYFTNVF